MRTELGKNVYTESVTDTFKRAFPELSEIKPKIYRPQSNSIYRNQPKMLQQYKISNLSQKSYFQDKYISTNKPSSNFMSFRDNRWTTVTKYKSKPQRINPWEKTGFVIPLHNRWNELPRSENYL